MSLEHLDDVAVHRVDGTVLLEQSKSALTSNPVADSALELWKTFANWAALCADKRVDAATTDFRLYVTPTRGGDLVEEMHVARSQAAATTILAKIKAIAGIRKETGYLDYVREFLRAGDAICGEIIRRFELTVQPDPIEGIREQLRATLTTDVVDTFCSQAIGMARDDADTLIRQGKSAIVSAHAYRTRFRAFVRKYNLTGFLPPSQKPPDDVVTNLVDTNPLFVRQLVAIEATYDLLAGAVSDFLRAESDRINWAEEGLILANSFSELDSDLLRYHGIARDEIEDEQSTESAERRGRQLYRKCAVYSARLEGRDLPSYFVSGEFNLLANELKLGWHPRFNDLFATD